MVRHGQTYYNASGKVQGRVNIPLNDKGKSQAIKLGQTIRDSHEVFDRLMASPLSRALETAHIIAKEIGYERPILVNHQFVERDFYHLDGTPVETAMPLVRSHGYAFEDYETDVKLIERISIAVKNLYQDHADERILLVAHSHVIKALMIYANPQKYTFADFIGHVDVIFFKVTADNISVIEHKKA
jgi:broad specificity phosphatase PhoE